MELGAVKRLQVTTQELLKTKQSQVMVSLFSFVCFFECQV